MTWSNYVNTGPFTNNTTPPGISATFLNNVETFLDQIKSSAAGDSTITSDGSGDITIPNNSAYQMKDSGGVARLLIGSDTSNNVYINMLSTTATIYFRRSDGTHIASLDSNGNLILKGTLTQGGSP